MYLALSASCFPSTGHAPSLPLVLPASPLLQGNAVDLVAASSDTYRGPGNIVLQVRCVAARAITFLGCSVVLWCRAAL